MLNNLPQLLNNLEYDAQQKMPIRHNDVKEPTCIVVFAGSDLNAASHYLAKSLKFPLGANAILTLLVQEAVRDEFVAKLQSKLPTYTAEDVAEHVDFRRAIEVVQRLKAKTITASTAPALGSAATLVCDLTHEHLGPSVTGLATMHTFRTAKEAISLIAKETKFTNATIWNENHSCAYELVVALNCRNFFLNCWEVSLAPLHKSVPDGSPLVAIEKSYHFETFYLDGLQKNVVFPIGTIFAN